MPFRPVGDRCLRHDRKKGKGGLPAAREWGKVDFKDLLLKGHYVMAAKKEKRECLLAKEGGDKKGSFRKPGDNNNNLL